jgi:hypothetical protein
MSEASPRRLDFIVIGVQKGGTTSLWRYLRDHPGIAMPVYKEAPIFCAEEDRIPRLLAELLSELARDKPRAKLGKVAAHYMMGKNSVSVEVIAERIARLLPEVRLIALLRDPIERAMSQYRMSVRRGLESRSFEQVVARQLEPEQLAIARAAPTETNSYVVQGEYGRILAAYRALLPAEQVHVEMTADLEREPAEVLDRVMEFIGLEPGYRPAGLGTHHHRGGASRRIDSEAEAQLRTFMKEEVWPALQPDDRSTRKAFQFFLETWNIVPDDELPDLASALRQRLEAHYRADAERLATLDIAAPWLTAGG